MILPMFLQGCAWKLGILVAMYLCINYPSHANVHMWGPMTPKKRGAPRIISYASTIAIIIAQTPFITKQQPLQRPGITASHL